jgi:hypothetical protein
MGMLVHVSSLPLPTSFVTSVDRSSRRVVVHVVVSILIAGCAGSELP